MSRKTNIAFFSLIAALLAGPAYSVTVSKTYVDKQDKALHSNTLKVIEMLNVKEDGAYVELDTEATAAIPAINELHSEMAGKQDAITAENPLSAENVSGLAEVATTGSYNSLSDKPEIPSTDNLATKEELQAVQAVVGDAESGLVKKVDENTAAIAGKADTSALESAVAGLDAKIEQAVIDSSNVDLTGYAKSEDVAKTYATNATVDAIDSRVEVLEGAGYQNAQQVQGAITSATAGFVTDSELGSYAKTETVNAELAKKANTADLKALAFKDMVASADIEPKAVTMDKIAGRTPVAGETLLMSVDADGNVTWMSVEILR